MTMAFRPLLALGAAAVSLGLMAACASGGNEDNYVGNGAGDSGIGGGDGATGLGGDGGGGASSDARAAADGGHHDGGGKPGSDGGHAGDGGQATGADGASSDGATGGEGSVADTGATDGGALDTGMVTPDTGTVTGMDSGTVNIITGGACLSGAAGAAAIRVGWTNAGGEAMSQILVEGLPDTSQDQAGTYGYGWGFSPSFVDPYLAQGGVGLDDSDFIDIAMSTNGITNISSATVAVYGRSYDTVASGSFSWQTFDGYGQTAVDYVSNVPPYQWYPADMTTEIGPGEDSVLVRVKAGPSSDSLVVNQIEILHGRELRRVCCRRRAAPPRDSAARVGASRPRPRRTRVAQARVGAAFGLVQDPRHRAGVRGGARRGGDAVRVVVGGNAGLAVAWAGRELGAGVTVFVPRTTSARMIDKMRAEGATVTVHGDAWDDAHQAALAASEGPGSFYVHPFDAPAVWTGNATLVEEAARQGMARPDAVVVSVGGGGLLCGVLQGMHAVGWRDVPVVAVETHGAASLRAAMQAGHPVDIGRIESIATTLGARKVCERVLAWTREHPVASWLASDRQAVDACLRFADDHRVVVEPACGAALAAVYERAPELAKARTVLVVVCGGAGATPADLVRWDQSLSR